MSEADVTPFKFWDTNPHNGRHLQAFLKHHAVGIGRVECKVPRTLHEQAVNCAPRPFASRLLGATLCPPDPRRSVRRTTQRTAIQRADTCETVNVGLWSVGTAVAGCVLGRGSGLGEMGKVQITINTSFL